MICPDSDKWGKKACIEMDRCTNPEYWASLSAHLSKKRAKLALKKSVKLYEAKKIPLCVKCGDWCDKKDACRVLGQCIVTLPRVLALPELLEKLRGPRTAKEIVNLLREYDPEPMRSYYLNSK